MTKESSIFSARRSTSFRILCRVLVRFSKTSQSNDAWEQRLGWIKSSQNYRNFDRFDGEPMEFEWNIFPGFNTFQLSEEVKSLLYRLGVKSMFNDTSYGTKTMKKNVWQTLDSYLCMQEDLEKDNGHSLVLVLRRSGTLSKKTVHKEFGTKLQKECCWNSLRADVQFSVLRLHCPEVNSKAKDMVNCRYTMQPTRKRLTLFFAYFSANQLSLYGAVADM